ncbi:MAG: sporulation protein YabP [Oscillospiraceae bacterium]
MIEDKKTIKAPHNLILEDRRALTVTGVSDIDSFDEEMVIVYTEQGELTIKGTDLHINKIDVDMGELNLEGEICSMSYTNNLPRKGNMFSKLFR